MKRFFMLAAAISAFLATGTGTAATIDDPIPRLTPIAGAPDLSKLDWKPRDSFSSRTTEAGKTIYEEAPPRRVRVFSEETCALVGDMLESAVQEGTAKKLRVLPYAVRAKTGTGGTKQGNRDAYTVAYTAEHTVGVWLGNADNTPVDATGGGLPASLALSALRALYARRDPAPFAPCETVVRTALDREAYER